MKRHNEEIKDNASIPTKEKSVYMLPEITFHGLRHSNATLLISQGVDVRTVSGRLGHAQMSTTTNIYSHFFRSTDRKAADVLEALLSKKKSAEHKQINLSGERK